MSADTENGWQFPDVSSVFADKSAAARSIWTLREDEDAATTFAGQPEAAKWLDEVGFKAKPRRHTLVPKPDGSLAGAAFGYGDGDAGVPCGPSALLLGELARALPAGDYALATPQTGMVDMAAIAWGLGAYDFRRYKTGPNDPPPRLVLPEGVNASRVKAIVEGIWLGRDLINTPTNDLGPADMEFAARELAERHKAKIEVTRGDELLTKNFPMIHAVGRASATAPRLIDMRWRPKSHTGDLKTVTIVGKGICFDTGGLDLKPAAAMNLMKKDMGGAATALALAHMLMALEVPVALRVLIPAAENSVSGNAFRPGDVLTSRSGKTVEIGNTDAEGRLVLADALSLADEEEPDTLISLATLTGAARVALGPDLPALFTYDDQFASSLANRGFAIGDPVWRLPLWKGYNSKLSSGVADMNNVSDGPFAGAITAALFLHRFVAKAGRYVHIDLYGWRPATRPLGRKGGEPHAARALLGAISQEVAS